MGSGPAPTALSLLLKLHIVESWVSSRLQVCKELILILFGALESLSRWCSACSCHDDSSQAGSSASALAAKAL